MLPISLLKSLVKTKKIVSEAEFKELQKKAVEENTPPEELMFKNKIITEELLYKLAAEEWQVPFVNLRNIIIAPEILNTIPQPIAETHKIVAFEKTPDKLKVAVLNPKDLETLEFLSRQTNLEIEVHIGTPAGLKEALRLYRRDITRELEEVEPSPTTELPVVQVAESLLVNAIFENASDIHIEPTEKDLVIRYRVDGQLRQVMTLPKAIEPGITSRIKVLAGLKIDEHRLPQDGRFKLTSESYDVTFRTSVVPTINGEKIAMRLLNERAEALSLNQLGFQPEHLESLKVNIERPKGMILVTGPTGSGKSTTLYSIIKVLNKTNVNIVTIEDPIEYTIPGINQSQINPKIGFSFANGLRSFLRQDPDIIMVGEIRDEETAEIAVHAALTGHLVLSTLHTNDAVTSLPRLLEMNIPGYLIASTVNIVIAQRLVRKICQNCIESYHLGKQNIKDIGKHFNIQNVTDFLVNKKVLSSARKSLSDVQFYRGKGCKVCGHSGYKGRTGIYEMLEVKGKIADMIMSQTSSQELQKEAVSEGMMTMLQDGLLKAVKGVTTVEEVIRATQEY